MEHTREGTTDPQTIHNHPFDKAQSTITVPGQGSLLVHSSSCLACTLEKQGITCVPLQNMAHRHTEEMLHSDPGLKLGFRTWTSLSKSISPTKKSDFMI